jgi:hypothetical protein
MPGDYIPVLTEKAFGINLGFYYIDMLRRQAR